MVSPNPQNILLVEDDEALLDLIPRVLVQAGFTVTATASAVSARNLLQQEEFGLIICDLSVIGGESAFQFINGMKDLKPELAVLIITGNVSVQIREQAKQHEIEILEKPFEPPDLIAVATRLLARAA